MLPLGGGEGRRRAGPKGKEGQRRAAPRGKGRHGHTTTSPTSYPTPNPKPKVGFCPYNYAAVEEADF